MQLQFGFKHLNVSISLNIDMTWVFQDEGRESEKLSLTIDVKNVQIKIKNVKKRENVTKNVCKRWIKNVTYTTLCLTPNV